MTGFTVMKCHRGLEKWNVGILGLAECNLFLIDNIDQELNSVHHPLFIPNIPFFHHSIIPLVILTANITPPV